ncbi:MAG: Fic family protein [Peptococcaceae bacterium]|nr:Fic family protein [Peptococcaceae bacterium]
MAPNFSDIDPLLQERADLQARLNLIPYEGGTPEIKTQGDRRYLYIRSRIAGKLTSAYVDVYSDDLYELLLRKTREAKALKKAIRRLDKQLAAAGYVTSALPAAVLDNLDFARANLKASIYDQAILEGVATTFPQTATIIEGGLVQGVAASDVQKILNLKHVWEFILGEDVIQSASNLDLLCHLARIINEGFFYNGGRIRGVPVQIGGTRYTPPLPIEADVKDQLAQITAADDDPVSVAIHLVLYCMRTQIFLDGNKRAAILLANHFLIARGAGLLVVPEAQVPDFKARLVAYYESADPTDIAAFMRSHCHRPL